ncbi:MAG: hypothetical protein AAF639_03235 [Chloroflexota bacterium]
MREKFHFEGGIHIPFVMQWPQALPAGVTVDSPVHHFDAVISVDNTLLETIQPDETYIYYPN